MKKLVALILLVALSLSLVIPASAFTSEQKDILNDYASQMKGTWQIATFNANSAVKGLEAKFTFDSNFLSITNDNRVFYLIDNVGGGTWCGGEVLLVNNTTGTPYIGFLYSYAGTTYTTYYEKIAD